MEDAELVERAQQGDTDAYAELVRRYQELAVRAAYLVIGDSDEAEDAAQEAFIKGFYALDRFQPDASFRPWLLRIVTNEARNLRKAAQRRAGRLSRVVGDISSGTTAPSAEVMALAQTQREALLEALADLREEDRLVIAYRYLFELSEGETAEALGWARGTVKSRLSRALVRLRERTQELAPGLVPIPAFQGLAEGALAGLRVHPPHAVARDLAEAVLHHITEAGAPAGAAPSGRPSQQQQVALALGALALLALGVLAVALSIRTAPVDQPPMRTTPVDQASPPNPAAGQKVAAYGAELSDAERQELAALFEADGPAVTETVSRDELVTTLQTAGFPVDETYRAISSAAVTCLEGGAGLRVRTRSITQVPAAAYAASSLTAGLVNASVTIAAPSSHPVTGETALVGVLKALPRCQSGREADPVRVQLAYQQLQATATLAREVGDWDRAAAVMLKALEPVVSGQAADEASIGAALDAAARSEGLALAPARQAETVALLQQLSRLDYGAYTPGYEIHQLAPDDVQIVPTGVGPVSVPPTPSPR